MITPETLRPLLAFLGLFVFLVWETLDPFFDFFRRQSAERGRHALRNLFLGTLNGILIALLFALLWASAVVLAEQRNWGLLRQLPLPSLAQGIAALLLLDLWTYYWHRINHVIPFLWRFHRTHHSDSQMDVTTANRFHPGEIIFSSLLRIPVILLIGARMGDLLLYETLLFLVVQFHHANIGLHPSLDRALRVFIVTPNLHKVHHSRLQPETDSNYASLFSFWDRIFGTFTLVDDPSRIRFGLDEFSAPEHQQMTGLLRTPFRPGKSPLTRRLGLLLLLLAFALWGFLSLHAAETVDLAPLIRKTEKRYPEVNSLSTAALQKLQAEGAPIVLWDVREPAEFQVSHIPGAVSVPPNSDWKTQLSKIPADHILIVYCSVGERSSALAQKIRSQKAPEVLNLAGGIFAWANEGGLLAPDTAKRVHGFNARWERYLQPHLREPF